MTSYKQRKKWGKEFDLIGYDKSATLMLSLSLFIYVSYEFVMMYPFNRGSHFPIMITIYSLSHSQAVIIINAYGWSAHVSHYFMLSFQSAKYNKKY